MDLLTRHPDFDDFGHHVIPHSINPMAVFGFDFDGYWQDIGTIRSFYDSQPGPDPARRGLQPLRRPPPDLHPLPLPARAPSLEDAGSPDVLLSEGCVISKAEITHSIIGLRSQIGPGTRIKDSIIMGGRLLPAPGTTRSPGHRRQLPHRRRDPGQERLPGRRRGHQALPPRHRAGPGRLRGAGRHRGDPQGHRPARGDADRALGSLRVPDIRPGSPSPASMDGLWRWTLGGGATLTLGRSWETLICIYRKWESCRAIDEGHDIDFYAAVTDDYSTLRAPAITWWPSPTFMASQTNQNQDPFLMSPLTVSLSSLRKTLCRSTRGPYGCPGGEGGALFGWNSIHIWGRRQFSCLPPGGNRRPI